MVLPFESPSDTAVTASLGPGTADSLITALLRVPELIVVDRASMTSILKEQAFSQSALADPDTAVRLGKLLGAQALITGGVQVVGGQVRLSAKFIDVTTGQIRQAEQITGDLTSVFHLQDELTTRFLHHYGVQLSSADAQAVATVFTATQNVDAYALYEKGRTAFLALRDDGSEDAVHWYDEALKLDPNYALAYAGKAEALTWLAIWKDYSDEDSAPFMAAAADNARKALSLKADLPEANRALATVEGKRHDPNPAARQAADRAVTLAPNDAEAYLARWLLIDPENPDHADIRRAIELNPRLVRARLHRSFALAGKERFSEGIAECDAAIQTSPHSVLAHDALAWQFFMQGSLPQAEAAIRTAIACDPVKPAPHANLAMFLLRQGQVDAAIAESQTALRYSPHYLRAHRLMARGLLAKGAHAEALQCARQAVELDPNGPSTQCLLGDALLATNDAEGALQAYRTALRLDPNSTAAKDGVAKALQASKKRD